MNSSPVFTVSGATGPVPALVISHPGEVLRGGIPVTAQAVRWRAGQEDGRARRGKETEVELVARGTLQARADEMIE